MTNGTARRIARRWNTAAKGNIDITNYQSSGTSPLQWSVSQTTADNALRYNQWLLRDKSRHLALFNPYGKRFFAELDANVCGADGYTLQMQVKQETPFTLADGTVIAAGMPDEGANEAIEDAWYEFWHDKGHVTVDGELSGPELDRLWLKAVACDGDCLVRIIPGFDNDWNFALQLFEADQLDPNYNEVLPSGNEIRMSVEIDKWGRRIAYHILPYKPGDWQYSASNGSSVQTYRDRIRIPAEECVFWFPKDRLNQTRGWPWLTPVIDKLNSIDKMDEAELAASRAAAEKMGFFTKTETAEEYSGQQDDKGNFIIQSQPGAIEQLPVGWTFQGWDPKHPTANYGEYLKTALRSVAGGVNMAYGTLANDRSDSSFSAERTAVMDERELYKVVQSGFAVGAKKPVFSAWLRMALVAGKVKLKNGSALRVTKFDKFNRPFFQGRRWGWLNPQQDINAAILAEQNGYKSKSQIIAEGGGYIEDVFTEIASDKALAQQHGLEFGNVARPKAPDSPLPDAANNSAPVAAVTQP
jgi:lambda family phage portal protein